MQPGGQPLADGGTSWADEDLAPEEITFELPPDEQAEPVAPVAEEESVEEEEIDKRAVPRGSSASAVVVDSVRDVEELLRAGRRDEAVAGLEKLRRKHPKNAYVAYLLGNLYFERRWWTDGMKAYRAAIQNNRAYRGRATLNRNVIRALGSAKTYGRASYLIRNDIGRAAIPFLRVAARTDKNPTVRARAERLLETLRKAKPPAKRSRRGHFR